MEQQIKMVVFDMAGTTVNENNLVYKTLMKAINEAGFSFNLDEVLEHGAGKEKKQAIRAVLAHGKVNDEVLTDNIFANFMVQLKNAYATEEILPQPNAAELFSELKKNNVLSVLNTGYDRTTAQSIIDKLGWTEGADFDGLVTASDVAENRPNPAMIEFAMKQFDIQNGNEVIKVGDSAIDIEEGRNAGCRYNIGITTGAHTAKQLQAADPDAVIDNLMDVLPFATK